MPATEGTGPSGPSLGATLRRLRRSRGLAQRDLTRPLHLGSHTAIGAYETGRRIPSATIIAAYERYFELPAGALRKLRDQALAERAAAEVRARLTASGSGAGPRHPTEPRQLPHSPETFVGRAAELAQLDRLLRDRDTPAPVVISAVSGMGGIGKTALAVHWAHLARDNFRDGELYVDMQGYHPSGRPVPPETAIEHFLAALGVAADSMPAGFAEQTGLYRTLMASRRMLVLIDNVRGVDQVRPLLPGSPGCRVLITSRSRLAGLSVRDGAQRVYLDCFAPRDAVSLLRELIGTRTALEPGATAALARLCGLHPLALSIAAERVVLGGASVSDAVSALSQAPDRLGEIAVPDDDQAAIRNVFTWSYAGLAEPEQRLFRLLGLHDGPDITVSACAALAGLGEPECADLLAALADANLVEEVAHGRYRLHDLLRLFARDCLAEQDRAAAATQAAYRLGAWYLASACAARQALDVNLPALTPVPAELSVPPAAFSSEAAALAWCDTERANLTATALSATAHGFDEIGWKLPTALFPYFDRRRSYGDWITTHQAAIESARRAGDQEAEGKVRCNLGSAYRPMRRLDEAVAQYQQAIELFRAVGWKQGQAKVLGNLASTRSEAGDLAAAIELNRSALELFRELDDKYGEALCLSNIGGTYGKLGEHDLAMKVLYQSLDAFAALGDQRGLARARGNLANVLARMNRHAESVSLSTDSIRLFAAVGDLHEQASQLVDLAESYLALGHRERAHRSLKEAREIFSALGEDWRIADLKDKFPGLAP